MNRNQSVFRKAQIALCALIAPVCPVLFLSTALAQQEKSPLRDLSGVWKSRDEKAIHEALERLANDPEAAKRSVARLTELLQWEWTEESKFSLDAEAATLLGTLGQAARQSVPALQERSQSSKRSPAFRVAAANALLRIDGLKPEMTRDLMLEYNRLWGGVSLFSSELPQKHPAEITRHLLKLTTDADPIVRERACYLLGENESFCGTVSFKANDMLAQAGTMTEEIPNVLARALADPVAKVQLAAAKGMLIRAPNRAEEIIPAVLAAVKAGEFQLKKCGTGDIPAQMLSRVPNRDKVLAAIRPMLDDSRPFIRSEAIDVLARMTVQPQLRDWLKTGASKYQRSGAATALSHTQESHRYEPDLLAALKDPELEVRFAAAVGLVSRYWRGPIAREVVTVLAEAIESTDKAMRLTALRWLLVIKEQGKTATASLKRATHDGDLEIRRDAALALVAVNLAEADEAVGPLSEALAAETGSKTLDLLDALGSLGPQARAALPTVEKFYRVPEASQYKAHAAMALARIDPECRGPEAIETLARMLVKKDSGNVSNDRIVALLMKLGTAAKLATPSLERQLSDPQTATVGAALAIVKIDPASAQSAKDWIQTQLAKEPKEDQVLELARELPKLGVAALPLLAEMRQMLQSSEPFLRQRAALALGQVGPGARQALPQLRKLSQADPNPSVKSRAAWAITQIEKDPTNQTAETID